MPRLLPGLELFFGWFEEVFFEFCMLLAFLDDMVTVVAAEVGEPSLSDDGLAVGGGGFEVAFGDPSGDGLLSVAEELRDGAYGHILDQLRFADKVCASVLYGRELA